MYLCMLLLGWACSVHQQPNTVVSSEIPAQGGSTTTEEGCCCWHQDAAGGGLDRFSTAQGSCDDHYTKIGCVDNNICEVGSIEQTAEERLQLLTASNNAQLKKISLTITGDSNHVYSYSKDSHSVTVLYYASPVQTVIDQWEKELAEQQFISTKEETPVESHGMIRTFQREHSDSEDASALQTIVVDFEEACQGGSGTCVWIDAVLCTDNASEELLCE